MLKQIKIRNIIAIMLGAAVFSFGFVHFNIQNQLGEGGLSGITLILYFTLGWDPALMNLLLNIPMFIIGYRLLGKKIICLYACRHFIRISFSKNFPKISIYHPFRG